MDVLNPIASRRLSRVGMGMLIAGVGISVPAIVFQIKAKEYGLKTEAYSRKTKSYTSLEFQLLDSGIGLALKF